MAPGDEEEAARLWAATWSDMELSLGQVPAPTTEEDHQRQVSRFAYMRAASPEGCFVAEDAGGLVGLAISMLQGPNFYLSYLGVGTSAQGQGLGRRLLEAARGFGAAATGGFIAAGPDPRSMSLYLKAGFRLSPAMQAFGVAPGRAARPAWLRVGEGDGPHLDLVDALDERVRGTARREDVEFMVSAGARVVSDEEGRAYALVGPTGDVHALGALDEAAAHQLLTALLAGSMGEMVKARWFSCHSPWAFRAAADAGARLVPHGALMTLGSMQLPASYLPNGAFG
jgi:GNAT superfamily N-acetyltransferase